jgi:hypothetical protein
MKKQEVTPGAVVQTKISKTTHNCNIVGWSADRVHVIVRSCSTGNTVYRTPRQLLLVVR